MLWVTAVFAKRCVPVIEKKMNALAARAEEAAVISQCRRKKGTNRNAFRRRGAEDALRAASATAPSNSDLTVMAGRTQFESDCEALRREAVNSRHSAQPSMCAEADWAWSAGSSPSRSAMISSG